MLELKNITKTYNSGSGKVQALKGIDLKFREAEFVSILGQSGCGKTTLLNIIGGLDRYTSGDLIINGKSTKKFKDRDWDAYRNYKVGFVFQNYNLIGHQTILSNVELALTIGGVPKKDRKARAIKALEEVGLKEHIYKKPNQLSGGQMQRVAIARALVNNPDIILADEPTGALDTKTSIQVMETLKKISKNKLIIMVTHNPELAEQYSSRIIRILDGVITEDSNPIKKNEKQIHNKTNKIGRTAMKFWTAFRLSLNNLLTKKGRTVLVSFAGSIGIIGIALILSVSNGFQAYVDHIQEDTLTSYPFSIMQETTDLSGALLAMTARNGEKGGEGVHEEQYISNMLGSLSTNDLKSFNTYLNENYDQVKDDIMSISYEYAVEPNIYTKKENGEVSKLNPSNLFGSSMGSFSILGTSSSVYSQMINNYDKLNESFDILEGHWPQKYDEMVIVLSEPNTISDLLVYSLGIRDIDELKSIVTKIMNGETAEVKNEPKNFTYKDLMNTKLKLIMPVDTYKYNSEYDVYEDMTENADFMNELYNNAIDLKIVGVVTAKEGVTSMALNPGVAYTEDLVKHIINYSKDKEIVKKQLANDEVDAISGARFDEKKDSFGFDLSNLITVDTDKIAGAFDIDIDLETVQAQTEGYMSQISDSITTDTSPAKNMFYENLKTFANEIMEEVQPDITEEQIDSAVANYLGKEMPANKMSEMENEYVIPSDVYYQTYSGLLKGLLQVYTSGYQSMAGLIAQTPSSEANELNNTEISMPEAISLDEIKRQLIDNIVPNYVESAIVQEASDQVAKAMTEAKVKKNVLTMVGQLTANLSSSFASAYNVDQSVFEDVFQMNITEDEIRRIVTAMMSNTDSSAKTNLSSFGYQNIEEPSHISFYFTSFDNKEHFIDFLGDYNNKVKLNGEDDKEIKYTDTSGILMGSVKTIVNAVTYVLIAFVSISLIVSSIMIGIITYISVYERTKEIGILRAMGASKHNISSIFNAETFIIGLLSGLFGIGITQMIIPMINSVIHAVAGNIPLDAVLYMDNAIILVILSIILTLIGGIIPAKAASKRDPVIALRTE